MVFNSEAFETNRWHMPEYVETWINNHTEEYERNCLRTKLVSLLPFESKDAVRVLDVGAGSGALTQEILAHFPNAYIVCQDFSDVMLDIAKQKMAKFSDKIDFVRSDLSTPEWVNSVSGTFDIVVCSLVIHAIPARAKDIYREIFPLIKQGGYFLMADSLSTPGPVLKQLCVKKRLENLQKTIKADTGIEKSIEEIELDLKEKPRSPNANYPERIRSPLRSILTIENHLAWLKQAGFNEVDCLWKDLQNGVIVAIKK